MKLKMTRVVLTKFKTLHAEKISLSADLFNEDDLFATPEPCPRYHTDSKLKIEAILKHPIDTYTFVNNVAVIPDCEISEKHQYIEHLHPVWYDIKPHYNKTEVQEYINNGTESLFGVPMPHTRICIWVQRTKNPETREWEFVKNPELILQRELAQSYFPILPFTTKD